MAFDTVKRFHSLLLERNMSLYHFCRTNGLNYSTVNTTEKRSGQLSLDTIERVCKGMGITLSDFFNWSEDRNGQSDGTESLRPGRSANG